MLQLKNLTPFRAAFGVFPDREGVDTLHAVVKGTFELGPRGDLAATQVAPTLIDEYWDDPAASSLKQAAELHLEKPGTDVVMKGNAWSPRPTPSSFVTLTAAGRQKTVRVFGDRTWTRSGGLTSPEPFTCKPLVYELAFGGRYQVPGAQRLLAEERNPVGLGFAGGRSSSEMAGQRAPNLEDPSNLIAQVGDHPSPACFAFVAPSWLPRRAYAGTYDEAWQRKRAPYLPTDFRARFFDVACPEMAFDRHFQGGEEVAVVGARREGDVRFRVPRIAVRVAARVSGRRKETAAALTRVLVELDESRFCLTWCSAIPCDKQALKIDAVTIALATPA